MDGLVTLDFAQDGVALFPAFLDDEEVSSLKKATDEAVEAALPPFQQPGLRDLVWHPRVLSVLDDLVGAPYVFHHIHAARQAAGTDGVWWHHDYLQFPQANRSHAMVHAFFYLNGLNGEVGDLVVVPGSHRSVMRGDAFAFMGTEPLPGEVVFHNVPPGTMIVAHSGVLHARRAKPGGEGSPRYFIDTSYCEVGVQWPGYANFDSMLTELSACRGADDRPSLLDPSHYFDMPTAHRIEAESKGSLVTETPLWTGAT